MFKSAGIVIIGDEILNGNVTDTNSSFLCKRFHLLGIKVCKVTIIPDDVEVISREVNQFHKLFDVVVTTGGIGPTHDDVTYEGVASAFNVSLKKHEEFEKFYKYYLRDVDSSAVKLITIPISAEVVVANLEKPLDQGYNFFPVVKIENVFCLPGIPLYVREIFIALEKQFFENIGTTYFSRIVYITVDEFFILPILNHLVEKFNNTVTFGSYPLIENKHTGNAQTKIIIESVSLDNCMTAENDLISQISPCWITFPKTSSSPDFDFIRRLFTSETHLSKVLQTSFQLINDCFSHFKHEETFISFNGGKDCTVLLNLIIYYSMTKGKEQQPLTLLYFKENDSFFEVDSFVEEIGNNYNVDIRTLPTPMKDSLTKFLLNEPKFKACFLGLRSTDPRTENLKPMQETDSGWPKLMRVCPILHWSYKDIWNFIRCANIPYCSLYNQGYTSLGTKSNTTTNPALKFINDDGFTYYKPAFLLNEDVNERHGRCSSKNTEITPMI